MGKGILIVLAATLFGGAIVMRNSQEMAFAAEGLVTTQEDEMLAREIARSAMNQAVAEARRSFDTAETIAYQDVSYQAGHFDVTAERIDASTVVLESVGRYMGRVARIRTTLTRATSVEAPIMADASSAAVTFGGSNLEVVGIDTAPPSAPGSSGSPDTDTNGIKTISADVKTEFLDALGAAPGRVFGVEGAGDIVDGTFRTDPNDIYDEAKSVADQTIPGGSIDNQTFGSPGSPAVVVIDGDANVAGQLTGYGVLVIDGDLSASGQFTWEGIVIAKSDGLNTHLSGNASIFGALYLLGDASAGGCAGGNALCFHMSGQSGVYFSTHAVNNAASKLPSVSTIIVADRWVDTQ